MSDWRIRRKEAEGREPNRPILVGTGTAAGR
jgi:hypothetical protein